jgi:hypothetical protein
MVQNQVIQSDDGQLRVLDRLAQLKDEVFVYDRQVRLEWTPAAAASACAAHRRSLTHDLGVLLSCDCA